MARLTLRRSLSLNDKDRYRKLDIEAAEIEASNSHETDGDITATHINVRRHSSRHSFKRLFSLDEQVESVDPQEAENLLTDENNADNTTISGNTTNQSRKRCPGCKVCIGIILIVVGIVSLGCYVIIPRITNKENAAPSSLKGSQPEDCYLLQEIGNYSYKSNPLGERCKPNSTFVQKYCLTEVAAVSNHACEKCLNDQLLPKFCFCDVGHQCGRIDAPEKQKCSDCQKNNITCPCINGGTCSCNNTKGTGIDLTCSCPKGYGGRYCEIIPVRLCKKKRGKLPDALSNCTESYKNECYDISAEMEYVCHIFTEDSDRAIKDFPDCSSERKGARDKEKEKQMKNEIVSKTEPQIGVGSRVIGHGYFLIALHIVPQIYISLW